MSTFTTPGKSTKSVPQAQADMKKMLYDYLETEEDDELVDRDLDRPKTPAGPKSKKRARKPATPPSNISSHGSGADESQDSPSRRKSARIAKGVKRASPRGSYDAAVDNVQPPAKKLKLSTDASEDNDQLPPPVKSLKRKNPISDEETDQAPPKKLKATIPSTSTSKVEPATVQKHTGRFAPINSQLPRAKKIEKQPVAAASGDAAENDEIDDDDIEDGAISVRANRSKGKAKKTVPPPFKGNPDMMGSSIEKPDDAPNSTHWKCANRNCTSGQTWHDRDGVNSYGRKVISNFFGRNKKETNFIDNDVWHNYCRKDYQRGTYRVGIQSNKAKCNYYIDNIEMQLVRIKLWRPEAKFTVQLSKGAATRLSTYHKELNKNNGDQTKAKKAVSKTAGVNAKGKEKPLSLEDAFPIEQLRHFDETFCKADQGFDEIDTVLAWTKNLVENGHIDSMPPMEFLITAQAEGETIVDPKTNYERWAAYEDGRDFDTPEPSDAEDEAQTEQVRDNDEKTEVHSDASTAGDETEVEQSENEAKTEKVDDDGEETEVDSNIADEIPNEDDLESLTDDETSNDDVSELDLPESASAPEKKKFRLRLVDPNNRPTGSTFSLTNKRKRDASDDAGDEPHDSTPSKYPRLPPGPFL